MYLALLPTWREYAEARAKRNEATAKRNEATAKRNEASAKWNEARAKWDEARAKWREASAKWREASAKLDEAYDKWLEAVHTVCGPDARIEWVDDGCLVLGVMLFLYDIHKGDQNGQPENSRAEVL